MAGAIVPARRGPLDLRAAVARAHARRHHRQRLRGPARPRRARLRRGRRLPARRLPTSSSGSSLTPADVTGAYAGVRPLISTGDPKKSVDISRKAELYETQLRPRDHHRRQAHDLAADGEDGGRPDRGARGPRGAVPHARDPARPAPPTSTRTCRRSRAWTTRARALLAAPLRLRGARACSRWPQERPELARRIVPDLPDLLAEAP